MPTQTVRSVIDLFLAQPWPGDPRALAAKFRRLGQFAASFCDKPADELRPADLHFWIVSNPRWRSNWTRQNVLAQIRHPFSWAARLRVIDRDPFYRMAFPRGERGQPMTEREFHSLLEHTKKKFFRWVLWFIRRTGCRPGEAGSLEWRHVDFDRGCATFRGKTTRITGQNRVIVLPPVVLEMLRVLKELKLHPRWVFVNSYGRKYRTEALCHMMDWVRKKAGLAGVKLYGLRHRYGTEGIIRGTDIKTLAELMGHASVKTTEYYVHIAGRVDHLMEAAKKLAE